MTRACGPHSRIHDTADETSGQSNAIRMRPSSSFSIRFECHSREETSPERGGALDIDDARGEFISPFDRTIFLEWHARECVVLTTRRA